MLELFVSARSCEKVQSENNMADLGTKALEDDTNDRHMEKLRCVRSGKMTRGRVEVRQIQQDDSRSSGGERRKSLEHRFKFNFIVKLAQCHGVRQHMDTAARVSRHQYNFR